MDEQTSMYPQTIIILHPETKVRRDGGFPFRAPNSDDIPLSPTQSRELGRVLLSVLDAKAPCSMAVYAGYLPGEDFHKQLEPEGTKFDGNLQYILFNGDLEECLFSSVQERWPGWPPKELSFLWSSDPSWLAVSSPDTAVTIIGCEDDLAGALLEAPSLEAFDWPAV